MATWEHPDLGRFKFVVDRWEREMKVPEFDAFSFEPSYDDEGNLDNRFELYFHTDSDEEPPSDAAVAVARKVLSDPVRIVKTVSAALWEDFNGRGPGSHMWWHGNMAMLAEALEEEEIPPPAGPDEVLPLLGLSSIGIRSPEGRLDRPAAEIAFGAAFEEEHGLGLLTDGEKVLGIGDVIDVALFEYAARLADRSEEE